jgi:alpha-galactosidase
MRPPCGLALAAILLAGSLPVLADEAEDTFNKLYAGDLNRVAATPAPADDVALAKQMLDDAKKVGDQAAFLVLLCEKAYELAARDPSALATATTAMDLLAAKVPQKKVECLQKNAAIYQKQYAAARGDARTKAGEKVMEALGALAEAEAAAGDSEEAAATLRQAIGVATAIKSGQKEALQARLENLASQQKVEKQVETLKAKLEADPKDAAARKELVRLCLVEMDDPAEAAKFLEETLDDAIRKYVPAAARPVEDAPEVACTELGDWYRALADQAAAPASKGAMLRRAQGYYRRFLELHTAPDLGRTAAALTLKKIEDALAKLGAASQKAASKVKVFILMGESNMLGMGELGPETKKGTLAYLTKTEKKYPFLIDDQGNWTVRKDVYYYDARMKTGGPLTPISNGKTIGPELGFGYVMGHVLDEPVLVLKSCIGNRSLGWDLLPPGSGRFTFEGRTYAGYKDTPSSWVQGEPKKEVAWYAGKQYDDDMANAKEVLKNLAQCYPDYKGQGYEVVGFVFWQGYKDTGSAAHASRYEQNLVRFIQCLRKDYNAPKAKFVLATIAHGGWKLAGPGLTVANAQLAVSDPKKHPEFVGNVKTVEARDFWREVDVSPSSEGYHLNRNAETYMEVGNALGWAMADLLKK